MENRALSIGSKILKAMGNQRRLQILFELLRREQNVGELENSLVLSQSALSQHLAVLRRSELVKTRRVAQSIYYSIKNPVVLNILSMLDKFYNQHYE